VICLYPSLGRIKLLVVVGGAATKANEHNVAEKEKDGVASAKRESSLLQLHCLTRRPVMIMKEANEMSKNE
jgi:hypothetical protein